MITLHQTKFATPQRTDINTIKHSAEYFSEHPLIRYLLNAVPDPFVVVNEYRQVVFANESFVQAVGVSQEEDTYGDRPGELLNCAHAHVEPGGCGTSEFCSTCGAAKAMLIGLSGKMSLQECRILTVSGEALDFKVWATPLEIEGTRYCVFSIKDISDEKRRRILERIFFHDVLNSVGVVSSYAQLLEIYPEEADSLVENLNSAANRLIEEIIAQKDLMAAENNELTATPVAINPYKILDQVANLYRSYGSLQGKDIHIETKPGDIHFVSDPIILGRVIGNLVKNALEATPNGTPIRIGYTVDAITITFWVNNPGAMPRNVQLQLFQRSFSTKGKDRGLGTYSIKLLTERYLGGNVQFTTNDEEGTTFFVSYPLKWHEPLMG